MKRRGFLAATGAGVATAIAGCTGFSGSQTETDAGGSPAPFEHPGTLDASFATNAELPADEDPSDGRPSEFPDAPDEPDADVSSFDTLDVSGETVRLVPIDVAEAWYRRAEARFVDARGLDQYRQAHVYGGVLSTAQRDSTGGGIDGWPTDDRVVTYCGCPHHLSSIRAAGLQKAGYSRVFAIDEGFTEWGDRSYPMAGTSFRSGTRSNVEEWTVDGAVDPTQAGEYAWASVENQYEAAPIREDGTFSLAIRFAGVTGDTPVEIATPAFTVTRPLGGLSADGITKPADDA